MDIAIRTDASNEIGTGHVTRCHCLADALHARGARITFVCRFLTPGLRARLEDAGHQVRMIDAAGAPDALPHAAWLGGSQEHDAAATASELQDVRPDWLVVDHYALDQRWERAMRSGARRILAIDDLADRPHDCDLLLDANLAEGASTRYQALVPPGARKLLGPGYALLRPEFAHARAHAQVRSRGVRRILVFFGGIDQQNQTGRVLRLLPGLLAPDVAIDVVIGQAHPRRDAVEDLCRSGGLICHVQTDRMAELMATADLAIGAGGTATWERCCVGLPALIWPQADNQMAQVAAAAHQGIVLAPEAVAHDDEALVMQLKAIAGNPGLLAAMSRSAMDTADGRGVARICRAMGVTGIAVRPATQADSDSLLAWRNVSAVRRVSRTTAVIARDDHERWLADTLSRSDRWLLIGERQGKAVGVVRFDLKGAGAETSIYLTPGPHPCGTGGDLLAAAESWLVRHGPSGLARLHADVLADNEASHHLFFSAGFDRTLSSYIKRIVTHG
ncbi:MAG: UDP-2,4-diacetamido-2,4,6-trideoxy-beta-L-altropyranose hydrolase [Hydrogenophaga sp.]|uniref:UDP-2,4-diacetamido-2,4, 6-trideoxy-beta-L-altropyranose hydrolase n=1 Tax=Hydrogenophaga sp. TaxID=1904254 RepID=UPI0026125360|nr:UDP-2,4-diacetamido-2,4,6-trideoxy-beta-L-altropyranose hydrolase [Hydrogenophaga sp.]MCV0437846.1 UDP-2,4-diacetamido-2,4,6-trideoxy-beta-L-altropyranose hydrolase [Hydrogenophaga sp.]